MNKCNFVVVFSDADGVNDVIGCKTIEEADNILKKEYETMKQDFEEEYDNSYGEYKGDGDSLDYPSAYLQADEGDYWQGEIFPVKKPDGTY